MSEAELIDKLYQPLNYSKKVKSMPPLLSRLLKMSMNAQGISLKIVVPFTDGTKLKCCNASRESLYVKGKQLKILNAILPLH